MTQQRSGFTLVELSIVLVILGLLVGGVLSGQSLIHAAELRSITKEQTQYVTALGAFKDKYFAMPGDMKNAVKFWGEADGATTDGVDSDCIAVATAATGTETCNGDGNGHIDSDVESFRSWQQLANAGLVEGTFAGVADSDGGAQTGYNDPKSKFGNGGWHLVYTSIASNSTAYFPGNYGNALEFGATTAGDATLTAPTLIATDAYNVDAKIDDGKPNTGTVLAPKHATLADCTASTNDTYDLANANVGCVLYLKTGY